jgi:hypothetical protein
LLLSVWLPLGLSLERFAACELLVVGLELRVLLALLLLLGAVVVVAVLTVLTVSMVLTIGAAGQVMFEPVTVSDL